MSEEKTTMVVIKKCRFCDNTFETGNPRKEFCSTKCWRRNYYLKHMREHSAYNSLKYAELCEKFESDSESYARHREKVRRSCRKHYELKNPGCKPYNPRIGTRIPDFFVKGQDVLDHGSVFLTGNMTDEQVISANDFALQQNAGEERHHPKVKTVFRK